MGAKQGAMEVSLRMRRRYDGARGQVEGQRGVQPGVRCASFRAVRVPMIAVLVSVLTASGCQGFGEPEASDCGLIPSGGCPTTGGGACSDRACEALYRCADGQWVRTDTCDRADAGEAPAEGGGLEAGPDGYSCGDATVTLDDDATGTCGEELFYGDCPASLAASCPGTACLSGCDDFFVCRSGEWVFAAYCEDGVLSWIDGF